MKRPNFITFTGIDERTDLTRADQLARTYPIEWGVLFSWKNRDARYPCNQAVDEILDIAGQKSAHVCGSWARDMAAGIAQIEIRLAEFDRCQINGVSVPTGHFGYLSKQYGVQVIRQTRGDFGGKDDFFELYDRSGGRGMLPERIPELEPSTLVGYAGGMGPDTVLDYLGMIEGDGEFWIDMEGQVRTDGWFDLDKVERVCGLVYGEAI